ncbi:cell division protein ZapA [Silicimonas algicola]|uniref:Cell division protein ZapA n=1 Tax=Silicimonas algicola TaxID=1826607 RepID=A0A316GUC3_9RHOB|nr:cell division protein ZapA [Silicimonas algicola]AZQ66331.1 cell division protein ZapA [Silicimonas algicola]PWK58657.1 cell division protein ZapA [Silicimonas algicola]
MPEVPIEIGGRIFNVACQEGEEHFLKSAASLLDNEASSLMEQIGRLPESRMLLMAGLMLADKHAGAEDQMKSMEDKIAQQEAWVEELQNRPKPTAERVEVAVVPPAVAETLAELAARAEALADAAEEKLRATG